MKPSIILALLLACVQAHAATLYKSVTADGKVVYSDQPPDSGKVAKTFNFANLPATPLPDSVLSYQKALEKGMQNRLSATPPGKDPVLFWAKWCGYCRQAEAYLAEKRIAYTRHDIDTADGKRALAQAGGGRGIPVLLASGQRVQGFSRPAYDAVFGGAGR